MAAAHFNALTLIALVLIGFSIGAAVVLLIANLRGLGVELQSRLSRFGGVVMLVALTCIQGAHGYHFLFGSDLYQSKVYLALLLIVSPAFYLFFLGVLEDAEAERPTRLLHFSPLLAAPFVANQIAIPLSYAFALVYSLRLLKFVYRLRAQRQSFRLERFAFLGFAGISTLLPMLGVIAPWLGATPYFIAYSWLLGLAFALVVYALLRFPDVLLRAGEAVRNAYVTSTLSSVDRSSVLVALNRVLVEEKVYTDENLNLASLADRVDLTPHQLSEFINTTFGVGFSRYIREHRVEAAKKMLLAEPSASVLSIGLAVGFTSQSNFYAAFREITGEVPGRFRKGHE